MGAIIPRMHVDAPIAGPLRYGLFNAATIRDLPDHGRAGGVEFEPDTCGTSHLYTAACPITSQASKTLTDASVTQGGDPFIVYADVVCSPVGRSAAEQSRRAAARLMAGEQSSAETAFWNGGGVGATPALTLAGATIVATALTSFPARLAALEQAFYDAYGYAGTIHVNTAAYGAAAHHQMIREVGTPTVASFVPALLTTNIGTVWSFGAGYDITGPANVAPSVATNVWAFITGPVSIWRSPDVLLPDPSQTFNRSTNQMVAIAEREYVIVPDCPTTFAIELPLEAP